ncbi:response regulator [Myceligenerans pegani]|uniref:Response regulator transcription factor n=1 Tax=Myceligenerans pegani TaxID=2776917 RepID=A0ABR9MVQ9_9MICO|nr:response regulator transcription factor [Myceligenerans sp. TRM 65318]MBE1875478.1 response regulator transcription factor [Myceligenerans sp. TRM 65318]MBE3017749.1 response regulator transcription factor [Myceligenerans sp. TRM 65318]
MDDDALARSAISSVLTSKGLDVVGEADDGDQVSDAIARHRPDVVLIDLRMRRVSGIEAIRQNTTAPNAPHFVALTSFGSDEEVNAAIDAGAAGFLYKDAGPDGIVGPIRDVVEHGGAFGGAAAAVLLRRATASQSDQYTARAREQLALLTEKEREVAAELIRSGTNQEIGRRLYISENTVKRHITSALRKLGLSDRTQLAVVADRAGIGRSTSGG